MDYLPLQKAYRQVAVGLVSLLDLMRVAGSGWSLRQIGSAQRKIYPSVPFRFDSVGIDYHTNYRYVESRISTLVQPKADPSEVFQSVWYRLVILCFALYLTVLWFVLGPSNPLYAVNVVLGTFGLGPAVAVPVMRRVPRQWFRVPKGERILHCLLGVGIFGWLLNVSGWNRIVAKPLRGFSGTRSGLGSLDQSLRGNVSAHGTCFAAHVLLAVLAFLSNHQWSASLWMLLPGVVVHLYPAFLQRSIMLRIQPLMNTNGQIG